jgi:hypothetical protein
VISVNSGAICTGGVFTMIPTGAFSYTFVNGSNTVSPTSNTSYSVNGSTQGGCLSVGYAVANVTVNPLPVVSVSSGSICPGALYTMTASGAATYIYEGGSPVVNPTSTTSYTVTGLSAQGCLSSNTATSTVTVWLPPVLSISGPTAVCSGQTVTMTAAGAMSYTWAASNTTLTTYTVAPTSNSTIIVVGSDANGCVASASHTLVAHALPVITVNSGTTCPGKSFTMTPNGAVSYVFQGGSAVVMPSATTMYTVMGTDANGCTSAMPAVSTVTVINVVNLSVTGNTTICSGETANLTASGAASYSWDPSNLTNTIAVNPANTTTYVVTGMTAGCSGSSAVTVIVNALPSMTISSSSPSICAGESATLTVSGADSYFWSNNASSSLIVVHPGVTTTYTVTGTGANTCSDKITFVQNVDACTGLSKIENASISASVYPNPGNGEFTVELGQETLVSVLNGIGQVVYTGKMSAGATKVILNNQPNGIYFVQLKQGSANKTIKIVKN